MALPLSPDKIGQDEVTFKRKQKEKATRVKEAAKKRGLDIAPEPVQRVFAVEAGKFVDKNGVPLIRGETLDVPIDSVKPNPWNYNEQSDFIYEKLGESLNAFGFTEPLTVRSSNEAGPLLDEAGKPFYQIIGGEHRHRKSVELGMKTIRVNDIGMMADDDLKKYMIILNETKGRPNQDALSSVIADMSKREVDLSILPYERAELESLISSSNFNWDDVTSPTIDVGGEEQGEEVENPDTDTLSIAEALSLGTIPIDIDAALAIRLAMLQELEDMPKESPWKCLELLLNSYYKHTKKKELLLTDTVEEVESDEIPENPDEEK